MRLPSKAWTIGESHGDRFTKTLYAVNRGALSAVRMTRNVGQGMKTRQRRGDVDWRRSGFRTLLFSREVDKEDCRDDQQDDELENHPQTPSTVAPINVPVRKYCAM